MNSGMQEVAKFMFSVYLTSVDTESPLPPFRQRVLQTPRFSISKRDRPKSPANRARHCLLFATKKFFPSPSAYDDPSSIPLPRSLPRSLPHSLPRSFSIDFSSKTQSNCQRISVFPAAPANWRIWHLSIRRWRPRLRLGSPRPTLTAFDLVEGGCD